MRSLGFGGGGGWSFTLHHKLSILRNFKKIYVQIIKQYVCGKFVECKNVKMEWYIYIYIYMVFLFYLWCFDMKYIQFTF
jgi:hypothetical protein